MVKSDWTPHDIVTQESILDVEVSTDKNKVAYVKKSIEKEDDKYSVYYRIYLYNLTTNKNIQISFGKVKDRNPKFSPKSTKLAFLSYREHEDIDKETTPQIWVINLEGGEPYPISSWDKPILNFEWLDEDNILFIAEEKDSRFDQEKEKAKDKSVFIDEEISNPPIRLFKLEVSSQKIEHFILTDKWIEELVIAPNRKKAFISIAQSLTYDFDSKIPPKFYILDLKNKELTQILDKEDLIPLNVKWTQNSKGFFFLNEKSDHPIYRVASIKELWFFDTSKKRSEKVEIGWKKGFTFTYDAFKDGVVAIVENGIKPKLAIIHKEGKKWKKRFAEGKLSHVEQVFSLGGEYLLFKYSRANKIPEWFIGKIKGSQLTDGKSVITLNEHLKSKPTGKVTIVKWKGAEGREIEGLLYYPLNYKKGSKYPLIVAPHGGPASKDTDFWSHRWAYPYILWQQEGYFVLCPNYHGSTGYGLDFVTSIRNKYYELERVDILNGVDHLVKKGLVDPQKIAISGWSNGGILAVDLITYDSRFKAASIGAADVEWFSDWANVDFGATFDNYYFGGPPWKKVKTYLEKSPFFKLEKVATPTIVFTGDEDRAVPPHQSWSLFKALQQIEKVPIRFVLFPGEPHGLRSPSHQIRKIEEELKWFRKFLKNQDSTYDPIPKHSPLANLLQLEKSSSYKGKYGVYNNGILVPEIIEYKGIKISKFEITRAQFSYFSKIEIPQGTHNYPVTNVTFEEAKRYTKWLSQKTGRKFRLPNLKEAKKLKSPPTGNSLKRWLGYEPNIDDERKIRKFILTHLKADQLLKEVGTFPGKTEGNSTIYDLDGNAAEWIDDGKTGTVQGPSCISHSDILQIPIEFVSFRIVEEE